jgi:hypothetical protein
VGRADPGLWSAVKTALSKTSFPRPAQDSFLPGGSMMRLTAEGDPAGQILLDYHDALEMEGYADLTNTLASMCTAFRTGDEAALAKWRC